MALESRRHAWAPYSQLRSIGRILLVVALIAAVISTFRIIESHRWHQLNIQLKADIDKGPTLTEKQEKLVQLGVALDRFGYTSTIVECVIMTAVPLIAGSALLLYCRSKRSYVIRQRDQR